MYEFTTRPLGTDDEEISLDDRLYEMIVDEGQFEQVEDICRNLSPEQFRQASRTCGYFDIEAPSPGSVAPTPAAPTQAQPRPRPARRVDPQVQALQRAILAAGCSLPRFGADGDWGEETESGVHCLTRSIGWESVVRQFPFVAQRMSRPADSSVVQRISQGLARLLPGGGRIMPDAEWKEDTPAGPAAPSSHGGTQSAYAQAPSYVPSYTPAPAQAPSPGQRPSSPVSHASVFPRRETESGSGVPGWLPWASAGVAFVFIVGLGSYMTRDK